MALQGRRLILAFTFVSLPLASALVLAQAGGARPPAAAPTTKSASGLDLSGLNRAVDPCTDFFQYACGGWIKNNPIPGDQARWGTFDALQERNNEILHRVLEDAAAGKDASAKKLGDYYASCMNEAAIEQKGVTPLSADLQKIAALKSANDLPALLAGLHIIGVNAFFAFGADADFKNASVVIAQLDQGGLGLPDRDYYFRADSRSGDIRGQYTDHVAKLATLAGSDAKNASASSATIMKIETSLAKAALDNVSRRDPEKVYHKLTAAELQTLTPNFDWTAYFKAAGAPAIDVIN